MTTTTISTNGKTSANGKTGGNGAVRANAPTSPIAKDPVTPAFDYARLRDLQGMPYLRSYECMQLLQIVRAAFSEADRATNRAERAPTEGAVRDALVEALTCLSTGEHYARMLLDQLIPVELAERDGGDVPLF